MTRIIRRRHGRQHGGVPMLLMLVLMLSAAVVGTLAIRGSVSDLGLIGAQRRAKLAFYCAEGGLNTARPYFIANQASWNLMFASNAPLTGTPPPGYPVNIDVDADGVVDVRVTIADDFDEYPPIANAPLFDNNMTAVMTATCNPDRTNADYGTMQRTLSTVVVMSGTSGTDYRYQAGHSSSHSGNQN